MRSRGSSKPGNDLSRYKEALQRAAALCSRQEQCTGHIRDKLTQWDVNNTDTEKIISWLQDEGYLDDHRYARFYAKDKFRFNGWGRIKISHMLRQKKVAEEAIGLALEQIGEEEYFQACVEAVRSKATTIKEKNMYTRKGKLFRFAAGRGFEPEVIHKAIDMIEQE